MGDKMQKATTGGRLAVFSYAVFIASFLYCGFRGLPLEKANLAFFGACLISLGFMVVFADILIKWTRTGRAMSMASAVSAAAIVSYVVFLRLRG